MFFDVTLHGHCTNRHQLTNVAIHDMKSLLIHLATRQAGGQLLRAACYDHFPSVPWDYVRGSIAVYRKLT